MAGRSIRPRGADEARCPSAAGQVGNPRRRDHNWPRSATPFFTGVGSASFSRGISEGGRDETDDEGKAGRGDDGLALGVAGVAGEWGGVGVWRAVED